MSPKHAFLFILIIGVQNARAQLVTTYAGTLQTAGAVDAPAPLSKFNNPHAVAVSPDGVVFVADRFNHSIRKIDLDGDVSTLAGKSGEKGDTDGAGDAARFNEPWGICLGTDGFLYVADTRNNKIRRVNAADGTVTTLAGTGVFGAFDGPALVSSWGNPTGIEQASDGTIFVAEHLTHTIRKISPAGVVSTVAGMAYAPGAADGTGQAARFWRPYGLAIDKNGQILVADEWNHRIRRIDPTTRAVTTVAGTGDIGNENGTAAVATFNYPWDICADLAGNIFVADGYNYVIRKITPSGAVSNWCGTPLVSGGVDGTGATASFSGATSIDFAAEQNMFYVGDAYNHLVRRIILLGGTTASIGILNPPAPGKTYCVGDTLRLQTSPDDASEYRFFRDGALVASSIFPKIDLPLPYSGVFKFHCEAVRGSSVLTSSEITATVSDLPQAAITVVGDVEFFEGDSAVLIASGTAGGFYAWSNGQAAPLVTVKTEGDYFVKITNANGCSAVSKTVSISVLPARIAPEISPGGDRTICPGSSLLLTSTYTDGNQWLRDDFPISGETGQTLSVTEAGEYRVQIIDAEGFTLHSEEVRIEVSDFEILDFSASKRAVEPEETIFFKPVFSENPASVLWQFGDDTTSDLKNPSHAYPAEGVFSVKLMAENAAGCADTLLKTAFINIEKTDNPNPPRDTTETTAELWLPNAFTPNDDGENDLFRPLGRAVADFDLQVFNHWGESVFLGKNLANGWDGRCSDHLPAPMATYTYLLDVRFSDGRERRFLVGKVTLVR